MRVCIGGAYVSSDLAENPWSGAFPFPFVAVRGFLLSFLCIPKSDPASARLICSLCCVSRKSVLTELGTETADAMKVVQLLTGVLLHCYQPCVAREYNLARSLCPSWVV